MEQLYNNPNNIFSHLVIKQKRTVEPKERKIVHGTGSCLKTTSKI